MIGMKYTPGLLAELAKTPHVRSMEIPTNPNGQWVSSFTRHYTDGWECKTTLFDVSDAELMSMTVDCGADGSILDHDVEKVTVSSQPAGLSVSFVVSRWFEEGLDKISIVLSPTASVELKSEIDAVSVIEETDEPWLVIVEPY